MIRTLIVVIDFFYPLFSRWFSKEVYHYLACGVINTCNDWVMYFLLYNFVIQKQYIDFGWFVMSPHIASLVLVTPITFAVGFCFSKYITFQHSTIHTVKQLFRYAAILAGNWVFTYLCLKLFVEVWGIYPTPSKMIATVITTITGFLLQKYYSFKKDKNLKKEENLSKEPVENNKAKEN